MSSNTDQSTDSIPKRQKTFERDEQEPLAKPALNFDGLPRELQEAILTEAAVALRLACETFKEVFVALALVCKHWHELLRDAVFHARVKQQTFTKDPMCRYLRKVQVIPVAGFEQKYVDVAVAFGDKLFTLESTYDGPGKIFVYDVDYRVVRDEERKERKITFANRCQLVLSEQIEVLPLIAPCSRTNSLYVVQNEDFVNATVLKVSAEDGTILKRWDLDISAWLIYGISLNSTGTYLIVTGVVRALVYDTFSGDLVKTNKNELKDEIFVGAALLDKSPESLVTVTASCALPHLGRAWGHNLAVDDYHCRLHSSPLHLTLYDNRTGRTRELRNSKSMNQLPDAVNLWYDKEHGLVFCSHKSGMTVMRVTY